MFPDGAEWILNPIGTAPGFLLKMTRCWFFFLPGVPVEMRRMMSEAVLPRIENRLGKDRSVSMTRTLSMFGITEAETGERLEGIPKEFPDVKAGFRAAFPVIQVTLHARGKEETALRRKLEEACKWASNQIGSAVFSLDGNSMEVEIGNLLRRKNATLGVAESCTGGLISDWITNVSGSSDYFLFSGVTYSNDAKIKVLGVSPDTLATYGAVHEETAKEMAAGARRLCGATYGLSTTGIAGPGGGTPEKPVGTVCIGLATAETNKAKRYQFPYPERLRNKAMFAMMALNLLRQELE
jgi:nicotinamide-nucleotide amidase